MSKIFPTSNEALSVFLESAARHFESLPTAGEDAAHWANVYNAENCRTAAKRINSITDLQEALQDIAEHTDPDDENSYRSDDREGCLDTVMAIARAAISKAEGSS